MRYLVLTNTPAHVHLYKHAVRRLQAAGHDVHVLGRDYGCTAALLDFYDLPHELYGACDTTAGSLFRELPRHFASIFRRARAFDPDLVFGIGAYAAFAGTVTRAPTVLVTDSEPVVIDQFVSRRLADAILTPYTFRKDLGPKHYEFAGFKETAYLHPDVFEVDESVRRELGVGPDERFAIVRLNAFGSHHDIGHGGFTEAQRRQLIETLREHLTVFVSDETGAFGDADDAVRPFDAHPGYMHDALAESALLVTDTQTMATEAALLGTPVIRSNSFVGESDMGNFLELEREGLIRNLSSFPDVLETAQRLSTDEGAVERWRTNRDEYVAGLDNLTDIIVDLATNRGCVDAVDGVRPWAESATAVRPGRTT